MSNSTLTSASASLRDRCLALADELAECGGIDRVDDGDIELAMAGLNDSNVYATAEALAYLADWFN